MTHEVRSDSVQESSQTRRSYLKGVGSLAVMYGVAGCTGSGPEGDSIQPKGTDENSSNASDWPPAGNTVEFAHTGATPDDSNAVVQFAYSKAAKGLYDGNIKTVVSANPAGQGVPLANRTYNSPGDGRLISTANIGDLAILELTNENAKWSTEEFEFLLGARQFTRCIFVSHHSTDVQSHWDWDWETFIDKVIDDDLVFGYVPAAPSTYLPITMIETNEPRLSLGDINKVAFPGGGELRSAVLRKEIDGVTFSFGGNYPRDDVYKCQFVYVDERYEDFLNGIYDIDPNAVTLSETPLPKDSVETMVDLVIGVQALYSSPSTSGEALETQIDVLSQASKSQEVEDLITDTLSPLAHTPIQREQLLDLVDSKLNQIRANEDIIKEILQS